ncbi:MAG: hypothetical protein J0L82_04670 [Deltaproteobacteria bacterium]|nr:hypothetical protein [Deltaproteobacteria bacterium]
MPDEQSKFWARVFLGISLSILIHVVTSVATWKLASNYETTSRKQQPILLEWIEPTKTLSSEWRNPETQIVRKTDLPPEALIPDSKEARRRFLSADRQTVKEESQAARSGLTENRSNSESTEHSRPKEQPAKPKTAANKKSESSRRLREPEENLQSALDGVLVKRFLSERDRAAVSPTRPDELLLPSDPRRIPGVSTSGELLPSDVKIGDFTALNTDRFTYYTFYARVEEQIRHRWVRYVKAALYGGGDVPIGRSDFLTNIEIVLDRRGEFVRAIIHQESGSKDLDTAPLLAFREARMIPNPPREMLKPDGTIRLLYSFHVDQVPPLAKRTQNTPDTDTSEDL